MVVAARVAGVPVLHALAQRHLPVEEFRQSIEQEVRFANISIIEGNEASQFGIGMVSARIAEIILRDERAVIPVGFFHSQYGTTFSLPSVVGRAGVARVLEPEMAEDERLAPRRCAETLKSAASRVVGRPRSAISAS